MEKETIKLLHKFTDDRDWDKFHSPANLAKSISIEAGELLECFQWTDDYDPRNVQEELADILTYCILLAEKLNLNMDEIIVEKVKKNTKKYPVEKAKGNCKKYTQL